MRRLLTTAGILLALAGALPSPANAQAFFTPWAGATFKGDAPARKLTYGAAMTFMDRTAGFEIDLGYTPDFFNQQAGLALIADSNVTTAMGSLVIGPRIGRVRPYGVAGLGIVRSRIGATDLFSHLDTNDFGVNAGGGVMIRISRRAWLRGDLRYFRSLQDPSNDNGLDVTLGKFYFWRGTVGVSFHL